MHQIYVLYDTGYLGNTAQSLVTRPAHTKHNIQLIPWNNIFNTAQHILLCMQFALPTLYQCCCDLRQTMSEVVSKLYEPGKNPVIIEVIKILLNPFPAGEFVLAALVPPKNHPSENLSEPATLRGKKKNICSTWECTKYWNLSRLLPDIT